MVVQGNGNGRLNGGNGAGHNGTVAGKTERRPRRLVLVAAPDGPVEQVLAEFQGAEVSGNRLHAELHRLANEHTGQCVAAEWLGPLGWTRFLWRRGSAT